MEGFQKNQKNQKYWYGILLFLSFVFHTFPLQVSAQSGLHNTKSPFPIAFQTASPIVNKLKPPANIFNNASEKTSNSSGTIFLSRLYHHNSNSFHLKSKNANKNDGSRKKKSFSKAGGRSQSLSRKKTTDNKSRGGIISVVEKVVPVLLFLALLKGVSGFLFGVDSNVVYYESSVYEKTIYNKKGDREQFRRESFRSNAPSMISDDRFMRGTAIDRYNDGTNSLRFLDQKLRDLDREIDNIYGGGL